MTWTAVDADAHTASDRPALDWSGRKSECLHVGFAPGTPGSATFRIVGDELRVTTALLGERACATASARSDGAFALPYVCLYHPEMRGDVVVVPKESESP